MAQVLLGIVGGGLLLLAVMVGLGEAGILSMASDSCGSENKCSTAATVAMLGFSAGGPILVLVIVGILVIISAMRKFSGAGSVVAILWYGVVADVVCIVAGSHGHRTELGVLRSANPITRPSGSGRRTRSSTGSVSLAVYRAFLRR